MDKPIEEIEREDAKARELRYVGVRRALEEAGHRRGMIRSESLTSAQARHLADDGCDETTETIRTDALAAIERLDGFPPLVDAVAYLDAGLVREPARHGPYSWARDLYSRAWVQGLRSVASR